MNNLFLSMLPVAGLLLLAAHTGGVPAAGQMGDEPVPVRRGSMAPNELGFIPIVEYHSIGGESEFKDGVLYDKHGLNIAPKTLASQLEKMAAAGWYPVNMRDILTPRIRVPRGRIPVALTFDDARPSQFRYLPNGKIDPNCAVGILEAFHARHPDWPRRATFYVLPETQWNGVPFDQDGLERRKLRFLVRHGYEVANHTTSHRSLAAMNAVQLRWEMAEAVRDIRRLAPRATMDTMALPYGIAPKDPQLWHWLLSGSQGRTRYHNHCILLASGGPAYPLAHRLFDRSRIPRIEPEPGNVEHWIESLRPDSEYAPFVSDGLWNTVTIPSPELISLNRRRLHGARLVVTTQQIPTKMRGASICHPNRARSCISFCSNGPRRQRPKPSTGP